MLVFFTNCLGVIEYAELKKLFYRKLNDKVAKSPKLADYVRHRHCTRMAQTNPEMDNFNFARDFKMDYNDIVSWLASICGELRSTVMLSHIKELLQKQIENGELTVGIAQAIILNAYAVTLLHKGSQVICNHAFAFDKECVANALREKEDAGIVSPVKMQPLFLHMEYFYFDGAEAKTDHEILKKAFIGRYFKALCSYGRLLPEQDILQAFKNFI